jgi:hypothetical protein
MTTIEQLDELMADGVNLDVGGRDFVIAAVDPCDDDRCPYGARCVARVDLVGVHAGADVEGAHWSVDDTVWV